MLVHTVVVKPNPVSKTFVCIRPTFYSIFSITVSIWNVLHMQNIIWATYLSVSSRYIIPLRGGGGYFFIKCVARGRRSRGVFHHDHRRLWVEISHQSNLTPALATRSGLEKTTNTNSKPARAMMPSRVLGENIREWNVHSCAGIGGEIEALGREALQVACSHTTSRVS